jgi:hypothetical protein
LCILGILDNFHYIVGGLDYLLPREYVNTMKQLHSNAPESKVSELFETIEQDLNCKVRQLENEKNFFKTNFNNLKK